MKKGTHISSFPKDFLGLESFVLPDYRRRLQAETVVLTFCKHLPIRTLPAVLGGVEFTFLSLLLPVPSPCLQKQQQKKNTPKTPHHWPPTHTPGIKTCSLSLPTSDFVSQQSISGHLNIAFILHSTIQFFLYTLNSSCIE